MEVVYISLPITGKDLEVVKARAEELKAQFTELGYKAVTPFDLSDNNVKTYGTYMGDDIRFIIDKADVVYLDDNWSYSRGCKTEWYCALVYGKKIWKSLDLKKRL